MNNYTHYARLGNNCQTSLDVLTSNAKFLPVNDPVYNLIWTRMQRYPLESDDCPLKNPQKQSIQEIDVGGLNPAVGTLENPNMAENYAPRKCCGRN